MTNGKVTMKDQAIPSAKSTFVTHRIYAKIFDLLENNPNGLSWTDLRTNVEESDNSFHPKTVNGCVWKLLERYPDKVYKPSKGIFRLKKFKNK